MEKIVRWIVLFTPCTAHTCLQTSPTAPIQIACIAVAKHTDQNVVKTRPKCMSETTARFAHLYLAIEQLAEDCGLTGMKGQEMWAGGQ